MSEGGSREHASAWDQEPRQEAGKRQKSGEQELRLLYFTSAGRAEPIRWILALKGVSYEDHRIDKPTQWKDFKPGLC